MNGPANPAAPDFEAAYACLTSYRRDRSWRSPGHDSADCCRRRPSTPRTPPPIWPTSMVRYRSTGRTRRSTPRAASHSCRATGCAPARASSRSGFLTDPSVDLDAYTTAELGSPSLLRLTEGRLILMVARARANRQSAASYQIDTPWGSAVTSRTRRIPRRRSPRGHETDPWNWPSFGARRSSPPTADRSSLRTGERAFARADGVPSRPEVFNAARMDTFGRWASARRDERLGRAASSRYLPTNLQMYGGTFDRYGAWENDAANGYVWYPTVDPGWRPVLQRLLVAAAHLRHDLDRSRRLGLADPSLRAMGLRALAVVLDS